MIEALCVRVTQVCQLKVEDIDLRQRRVWLRPFKRHRGLWKPLVPSLVTAIKKWKTQGWKWPKQGYLFPSRKGATQKHITKDIVARNVRKHRATFVKKWSAKYPELQNGLKIRSHSGRRHAISEMAGSGVPHYIGMAWSQIESCKVYQTYVDLEPVQVYPSVARYDKRRHRQR